MSCCAGLLCCSTEGECQCHESNSCILTVGTERATLSGLMANGIAETNKKHAHAERNEAPSCSRLNLIVNGLVLVVENQHRIMRELRELSGLNIQSPSLALDENGTEIRDDVLRLVGESIRQSDGLGYLQNLRQLL